jgi:hypothetical protein
MNQRRIHELMRSRFPAIDAVEHEWANMHDGCAPRTEAIASLLCETFSAAEVLVEVHRKLGGLFPLSEAAAYIGAHIGQGQIRVADREFTSFVVVATNGVATAWRTTDNRSVNADGPVAAGYLERSTSAGPLG